MGFVNSWVKWHKRVSGIPLFSIQFDTDTKNLHIQAANGSFFNVTPKHNNQLIDVTPIEPRRLIR